MAKTTADSDDEDELSQGEVGEMYFENIGKPLMMSEWAAEYNSCANSAVEERDFAGAIKLYSKAISLCETAKRTTQVCLYMANRASASLADSDASSALADAERVLVLADAVDADDPTAKCSRHVGVTIQVAALRALGRHADARKARRVARKLTLNLEEPGSPGSETSASSPARAIRSPLASPASPARELGASGSFARDDDAKPVPVLGELGRGAKGDDDDLASRDGFPSSNPRPNDADAKDDGGDDDEEAWRRDGKDDDSESKWDDDEDDDDESDYDFDDFDLGGGSGLGLNALLASGNFSSNLRAALLGEDEKAAASGEETDWKPPATSGLDNSAPILDWKPPERPGLNNSMPALQTVG